MTDIASNYEQCVIKKIKKGKKKNKIKKTIKMKYNNHINKIKINFRSDI